MLFLVFSTLTFFFCTVTLACPLFCLRHCYYTQHLQWTFKKCPWTTVVPKVVFFFFQDVINQNKQSPSSFPSLIRSDLQTFYTWLSLCQKILLSSLWMDNVTSFISSNLRLAQSSILDKILGCIHSLKTIYPFSSTNNTYTFILVYFLD